MANRCFMIADLVFIHTNGVALDGSAGIAFGSYDLRMFRQQVNDIEPAGQGAFIDRKAGDLGGDAGQF